MKNDVKRKCYVCMMLIGGAAIGWSIALNYWLFAHTRAPERWLHFVPTYLVPLLFGVCSTWRNRDLRLRIAIGITIGASLGYALGPAVSSTFDWRSAMVFTNPLVAFSPTAVSTGSIIGGIFAVFLPELRRLLSRVNGKVGNSS